MSVARRFVLRACPELFTIPLPDNCTLSSIVCTYGFFRLQPNTWLAPNNKLVAVNIIDPNSQVSSEVTTQLSPSPLSDDDDDEYRHGCFVRALRYAESESAVLLVAVTQRIRELIVRIIDPLYDAATQFTAAQTTRLRCAVERMFHLSTPNEHYVEFHDAVPSSKARGFARLFRSATLWEDMLKTILVCNVNWKGTIAMNTAFCSKVGFGRKRQYQISTISDNNGQTSTNTFTLGIFPTAAEVAAVSNEQLRLDCRVGYRSQRIIDLAVACVNGLEHRLETLIKTNDMATDTLYKAILLLNGFGPFASANVCAMMGRYDVHPFDSETVRHMKQVHKVNTTLKPDKIMALAKQHYSIEKFGKFPFLVYWFELWNGYEATGGSVAHEWTEQTFSSFSNGGKKKDGTLKSAFKATKRQRSKVAAAESDEQEESVEESNPISTVDKRTNRRAAVTQDTVTVTATEVPSTTRRSRRRL